MRTFVLITILSLGQMLAFSQPEIPIEQWTDKTILLIGALTDGIGRQIRSGKVFFALNYIQER